MLRNFLRVNIQKIRKRTSSVDIPIIIDPTPQPEIGIFFLNQNAFIKKNVYLKTE